MPAVRITHAVRSDGFAGVERYICDVAPLLAARGHDVLVIGGEPARMAVELPGQLEHRPATTTADVARALATTGRRDIVHVHMTAAELAGVATRPRHRARVVATRHFAAGRGSNALVRAAGRALAGGLTAQVSISRFVAGSVGAPSVVIPNGVPPAEQAALAGRTVVLLQRLDREKSPATALHAWAASALPARGWTLLVAGRGALADDLRSLARALDIEDSVRFLGYVRDTAALLAEASVFLATAPAEPFGLAVVEAMAHGLPVVAADGGAHRETVAGEGLLFPPGDAARCAALLDRLGEDDALRWRVGTALRRRQQELFGLDGHVDALAKLYGSLTGSATR